MSQLISREAQIAANLNTKLKLLANEVVSSTDIVLVDNYTILIGNAHDAYQKLRNHHVTTPSGITPKKRIILSTDKLNKELASSVSKQKGKEKKNIVFFDLDDTLVEKEHIIDNATGLVASFKQDPNTLVFLITNSGKTTEAVAGLPIGTQVYAEHFIFVLKEQYGTEFDGVLCYVDLPQDEINKKRKPYTHFANTALNLAKLTTDNINSVIVVGDSSDDMSFAANIAIEWKKLNTTYTVHTTSALASTEKKAKRSLEDDKVCHNINTTYQDINRGLTNEHKKAFNRIGVTSNFYPAPTASLDSYNPNKILEACKKIYKDSGISTNKNFAKNINNDIAGIERNWNAIKLKLEDIDSSIIQEYTNNKNRKAAPNIQTTSSGIPPEKPVIKEKKAPIFPFRTPFVLKKSASENKELVAGFEKFKASIKAEVTEQKKIYDELKAVDLEKLNIKKFEQMPGKIRTGNKISRISFKHPEKDITIECITDPNSDRIVKIDLKNGDALEKDETLVLIGLPNIEAQLSGIFIEKTGPSQPEITQNSKQTFEIGAITNAERIALKSSSHSRQH
ncbi:MAG: hypothetical protein K0R98_347 [Rickettsiaceae bacterium]|nr:hypothetical protein [Rickettsiaceae bacterium]